MQNTVTAYLKENADYYAFYSFLVFCLCVFIFGGLSKYYGGNANLGYSTEGHYFLKSKLENPVEVTYSIWVISIIAQWLFYLSGIHLLLALVIYKYNKAVKKVNVT